MEAVGMSLFPLYFLCEDCIAWLWNWPDCDTIKYST